MGAVINFSLRVWKLVSASSVHSKESEGFLVQSCNGLQSWAKHGMSLL